MRNISKHFLFQQRQRILKRFYINKEETYVCIFILIREQLLQDSPAKLNEINLYSTNDAM